MDPRDILKAMEAERDLLDKAIVAVKGWVSSGRTASAGAAGTASRARAAKPTRQLSAAARKRISASMKKKWKERRANAKG